MDYKLSGVDISAGNETIKRIKPLVKQTFGKNVLSELGSFGGLYELDNENKKNMVLVSSTDGVGTKLCIAKSLELYDTIGKDLVNHCVNDIFVHGAQPLFFLDYIGIGNVQPERIESIVRGMVIACKEHSMALIGGEIAEMPDIYRGEDFDLVGTIIGQVERERIVNGNRISEGDIIVGFSSSGLHTNGYTLARRILFDKLKLNVTDKIGISDESVGELLLATHKSYYHCLKDYAKPDLIHGMAHITGGGIAGNLSRIIPDNLSAVIECNWETPQIFTFLQKEGKITEEEMYKVFNMGIGFIVVAPPENAALLVERCSGSIIGRIVRTEKLDKVVLRR